MLMRGTIHQEFKTIINIYIPNISTPSHVTQILPEIKGQTDFNIIMGDSMPQAH
jgi:hypothetical protein